MDFNTFLKKYEEIVEEKESFIREGQALMNYLATVWFDEYERITATDIDCFYNDDLIPSTLDHLKKVWKIEKMKFNNRENKAYETEDGIIYHSRSVALTCSIMCRYNDATYVLIGKRSKLMDNAGKLNMVCGYLDWDESIYDGFRREVYEESKLNINEILSSDKYSIAYHNKQPWRVSDSIDNDKQNITLNMGLLFKADELPHVEPDEESEWMKWVKVKDFLYLIEPNTVAFNHQQVLLDFIAQL